MARPLRIEFAGALYHVTARGNARELIYRQDRDRIYFQERLAKTNGRFGWLCHAFCFMDNHYHLVIETPRPNLARGMCYLNGSYAQWFNSCYDRVGHVFQARYSATLVERGEHFLELCRYVPLNPVRARLCDLPEEWEWSSYRATAGQAKVPPFLTINWVLAEFGSTLAEAQAGYRRFVAEGITDRRAFSPFAGGDDFLQSHSSRERIPEVPRPYWQPSRPSLDELFVCHGSKALAVAYRDYGYVMREIAEHLGVSYSTVSRRLRAFEREAA